MVITGTAQGMGAACAEKFHYNGYQVIGLDLKPPVDREKAKLFKSHHIVDLAKPLDIQEFAENLSKEIPSLDVLVSDQKCRRENRTHVVCVSNKVLCGKRNRYEYQKTIGQQSGSNYRHVALTMTAITTEILQLQVNCAGLHIAKSVLDHTEEEYDKMMAVNLKAPWLLIKYLLPLMKKGQFKNRSIVNITTLFVESCPPKRSAYTASKAGLQGITTALVSAFKDAKLG